MIKVTLILRQTGAFMSSKKRFLTKVFLDLYVSSIKAALMSMARDHRCQRSLNVLISDFLPFRFLFVFSIGPITTGCNLCGRENSKFSSTTQVQSSLTTPRHLRSSCRRSSTPLKSRYASQPSIYPSCLVIGVSWWNNLRLNLVRRRLCQDGFKSVQVSAAN